MQQLQTGAHLAGKYQVVEVLEVRPYSARYLARDSVLQKRWVIRQLEIPLEGPQKKAFLDHFYAEGERQSAINLETLPRVDGFFAEKGYAYTVTEYVAGKSVADVLRENGGTVPEAQAREWFESLGSVLRSLHEMDPPIALGGFDAASLAVTERGAMRLREYGLLRVMPPERHAEVPRDGLPRWHQQEGQGPYVSVRADLWSLGALAYYLLTGVELRRGDAGVLRKLRPDVTERFASVIENCLAPEGPLFESLEQAMRELQGRVDETAAVPARLAAEPPQLLIRSQAGAVSLERVQVGNQSGHAISCQVRSMAPWLQVAPQQFDGVEQEFQVWIDPAALGEETTARSELCFSSGDGELRLPVTVEVQQMPRHSITLLRAAMVLISLVCLGALAWVHVDKLAAASSFSLSHPDMDKDPSKVTELVTFRKVGTYLMLGRFIGAIAIPLLVFGLWSMLSGAARKRTTLIAMMAMALPALASLIAMRMTAYTFSDSPIAFWIRMAPSDGGWLCIFGTLTATAVLVIFGIGRSIRGVGLAFAALVLLAFYCYLCYGYF